ncbi:MAG: hypothetical protein BWY46_00965 [Firmicutes bacterium ADurb.Bin300]|nr:MAG: hypothetical protein BWY46_00965 [Firmicutes bacterium ADurb.Bin300]HOD02159.1 hypothetical protein [Clostridiales bacterium]
MVEIFLAAKIWDSEIIGKFYSALKKLPDEEKCDCSIFIAQTLQKRGGNSNISAAAEILEYGINNYNNVSTETKARMHWAFGYIIEYHLQNYEDAYQQYLLWKDLNSKTSGVYIALTRCLLLRDNFVYSPELEENLLKSGGEGDLGRGEDRLYESIAWYLVYAKQGNKKKMAQYRGIAQAILKSDENFLPDYVFRNDAEKEELNIPQNVRIYVKEMP